MGAPLPRGRRRWSSESYVTPVRSPFATDTVTVEQIIARHQQRQTYRQIAQALGIGQSTVARILKRQGLNRLAVLSPARPDNRYEHDVPGDLLHLDIKKLGACLALLLTVRYYASLGIRFTRVLTYNGACYRSCRFQRLCRRLQLKHRRTRPYSPHINGKAERFIQTVLREWAYACRTRVRKSVVGICLPGSISTIGIDPMPV